MMLVLSMSMAAWAADAETGSITLNGIKVEKDEENQYATYATYNVYQMLVLESYDTSKQAYSYKVDEESDWSGFFKSEDGKKYFSIDEKTGYATWIGGTTDATYAEFSKIALEYAKKNNIDPVKTTLNADDYSIVENSLNESALTASIAFNGLPLGYYLIDSDIGVLCGLTTTSPHAEVNAKNGTPTITKLVQEDSSVNTGTNEWFTTNTADIGQEVKFDVTIDVSAGAQNYIVHDKMDDGLSFNSDSVIIKHHVPGGLTVDVVNEDDVINYEVKTTGLEDGCTFEIVFSESFVKTLKANDKLYISYTAILKENAVIAGEGNKNTTWLEFGEGHETEESVTTTYTYGFDIIKTDSSKNLIDGAKFKIYNAKENGEAFKVVLMADGKTYRKATNTLEGEKENDNTIIVKDGNVRVIGFDNGTYYLEEIEAPDGYNKLTERKEFIINNSNLDATVNDGVYSSGSGVHVENKTGTRLPETGARGTMMFITFGMIMVLGAGVLLVTKKRMGMIQD